MEGLPVVGAVHGRAHIWAGPPGAVRPQIPSGVRSWVLSIGAAMTSPLGLSAHEESSDGDAPLAWGTGQRHSRTVPSCPPVSSAPLAV